jgi:hypothetical protein
MPKCVVHCEIFSYADDVQLIFSCPVSRAALGAKLVTEDLNNISDWAPSNGLRLNPNKTQVTVFGQSADLRLISGQLPLLRLNNVDIPYVDQVKNLGVIFDPTLSWCPYIKNISRRIMGGIYSLNRSRNFIPLELKPRLTQQLLFPYFKVKVTFSKKSS